MCKLLGGLGQLWNVNQENKYKSTPQPFIRNQGSYLYQVTRWLCKIYTCKEIFMIHVDEGVLVKNFFLVVLQDLTKNS